MSGEEEKDDNMLQNKEEAYKEEHRIQEKNLSAFDDDFVTGKISSSSSFEEGVEEGREMNNDEVMNFNNKEQNDEEENEDNR